MSRWELIICWRRLSDTCALFSTRSRGGPPSAGLSTPAGLVFLFGRCKTWCYFFFLPPQMFTRSPKCSLEIAAWSETRGEKKGNPSKFILHPRKDLRSNRTAGRFNPQTQQNSQLINAISASRRSEIESIPSFSHLTKSNKSSLSTQAARDLQQILPDSILPNQPQSASSRMSNTKRWSDPSKTCNCGALSAATRGPPVLNFQTAL